MKSTERNTLTEHRRLNAGLPARCAAASAAAALVLAIGAAAPSPASVAYADDLQDAVDSAQTELDSAEAQMNSIVDQYNRTQSEVQSMQEQIDDTTELANDAQQAVLDGRSKLADAANVQYRDNEPFQLLKLVVDSNSVEDLFQNMTYIDFIMKDRAEAIEEQQQRRDHYDDVMNDLNAQKDAQEEKLAELDTQRAQAQQVVSDATAKLQNAQGEQAARLAALQAQQEQLAAQQADDSTADESQAQISGDWNTNTDGGDATAASSATQQQEQQQQAQQPAAESSSSKSGSSSGSSSSSASSDSSSSSSSSGSSSSNVGWKTGLASAYGGSSDPNTPNPGTTATGAVCDDNSMGVAVSTHMSGYRALLGSTVEISYNGRTVLARVNDCGGLAGGSRALDLQPGVFKALGFSSCQAWGVRTISYRFL